MHQDPLVIGISQFNTATMLSTVRQPEHQLLDRTREINMTTVDEAMRRPLAIGEEDSDTQGGLAELLECCGGGRVSVVIVPHRIDEALRAARTDQVKARAMRLLDQVLERGAWHLE